MPTTPVAASRENAALGVRGGAAFRECGALTRRRYKKFSCVSMTLVSSALAGILIAWLGLELKAQSLTTPGMDRKFMAVMSEPAESTPVPRADNVSPSANVPVYAPAPDSRQPQHDAAIPLFKGHDLPRLRGTMIHPNIDANSLHLLGRDWKANLIRWQLVRPGSPGQPSSLEEFDGWLDNELRKLDSALSWCEQDGVYVVLDLHSPPGGKATSGGYVGSDDRFFTDPICQAKFVDLWQRIAQRYKHAKPIWGYDLANEPVEDVVAANCDHWPELAERAAKAIRSVDPNRAIIVEPAAWGGPEGFRTLKPLRVSNVVYSVHMYIPHAFTHQGVNQNGPEYRYPGVIGEKLWDKARLEAALQPVVEFQQKYHTHIYVGEFSAIRWAPDNSACRYLKDLIDIFEAHGWDWTYHAYREWNGWSVEHGPDRQNNARSSAPTDRQQLLCDWFARNQKPAWTRSTPSSTHR
jgi:endoglucanase